MKRACIYVDSPTGTQTHVLNENGNGRALCGALAAGWQTALAVTRMCCRCRKIQKRMMLAKTLP